MTTITNSQQLDETITTKTKEEEKAELKESVINKLLNSSSPSSPSSSSTQATAPPTRKKPKICALEEIDSIFSSKKKMKSSLISEINQDSSVSKVIEDDEEEEEEEEEEANILERAKLFLDFSKGKNPLNIDNNASSTKECVEITAMEESAPTKLENSIKLDPRIQVMSDGEVTDDSSEEEDEESMDSSLNESMEKGEGEVQPYVEMEVGIGVFDAPGAIEKEGSTSKMEGVTEVLIRNEKDVWKQPTKESESEVATKEPLDIQSLIKAKKEM